MAYEGVTGAAFCSFNAYLNANVTNATGDGTTVVPIVLNSTAFNVGSNFSTGTGIFTAPVTGKYLFCGTVSIGNIGVHTNGRFFIEIFNGASNVQDIEFASFSPVNSAGTNVYTATGSFVCQMTAGWLAELTCVVSGSTKTITLNGSNALATTPYCQFSGYLLE